MTDALTLFDPDDYSDRTAASDDPVCLDCGVDTLEAGHYPYLAPDDVWQAVVPHGRGMLCLPCLRGRLDVAGIVWPWAETIDEMLEAIAARYAEIARRYAAGQGE